MAGGLGADTMIGGAGNDTYFVDNTLDVITEGTTEGLSDLVYSTATNYMLADNVENLVIWGAGLNGTGNDSANYIFGNAANNILTGGNGADVLSGGLGKDTYNLAETIAASDILYIATGDSLVGSYDVANNFALGTGNSTTGVDVLNLDTTLIAANVAAVDGTDSGIIQSHSINNGMINFSNTNNYSTPLTLTDANLTDIIGYLQANISGGNTVAFIDNGNTYVFQDGGVTDTLVELVGVTATSLSTTGSAAGSVWIM